MESKIFYSYYNQNETQLALMEVKNTVRKKIEAERKIPKKPSPIADIVSQVFVLFEYEEKKLINLIIKKR